MLRQKIEMVVGQVTEAEMEYALEKMTLAFNQDGLYYSNDSHLYDIMIEEILEFRFKGVQNV